MELIILAETKQLSGIFWIIYIIILVCFTILIIHCIKKHKEKKNSYNQKYLQLLEEQNKLLRKQLNRDK